MRCASCGEDGDGRFCSHCGAALGGVTCPGCGHEPPAGARFCNQCGAALAAGAKPTRAYAGAATRTDPLNEPNRALRYMAGALIVGSVLAVAFAAYLAYRPDGAAGGRPPAAPAAGASSVDLSTMTPREAADRLFNRVMTAAEAGDADEVRNFLPMAIRAHEIVNDLDADGKFHLALLKLRGSLTEDALASAEEILEEQPDHLLGLAGAADASLALGDSSSARVFYQRWLDVYDSEMAKDLSEYRDHGEYLRTTRGTAQALLGSD